MAASTTNLSQLDLLATMTTLIQLQKNEQVYVFGQNQNGYYANRGLSDAIRGGRMIILNYLDTLPEVFSNATIINLITGEIFTQSADAYQYCQVDNLLKHHKITMTTSDLEFSDAITKVRAILTPTPPTEAIGLGTTILQFFGL